MREDRPVPLSERHHPVRRGAKWGGGLGGWEREGEEREGGMGEGGRKKGATQNTLFFFQRAPSIDAVRAPRAATHSIIHCTTRARTRTPSPLARASPSEEQTRALRAHSVAGKGTVPKGQSCGGLQSAPPRPLSAWLRFSIKPAGPRASPSSSPASSSRQGSLPSKPLCLRVVAWPSLPVLPLPLWSCGNRSRLSSCGPRSRDRPRLLTPPSRKSRRPPCSRRSSTVPA